MRQVDWIMLVIGVIISVGGFVGTLVVATCAWFIRRLIRSVDDLKVATERHTLELRERPTWAESGQEMKKIADNRITVHERDYDHSPREGGREFSQRNQ
jgi:hypothetical protein